jgi:glutamate racemase
LIAKEYLFPLKLEKIDTLVLGCTHYPLLRELISTTLNNGTTLIDSGEAAAEEVEALLDKHGLRNPSTLKGNIQCYVSDLAPKFAGIGERFLGHKLGKVRIASASEMPVK